MKKVVLIVFSLMLANSYAVACNKPCGVTFSLGDAYYHFANKRKIEYTWVPNASIGYNFDQHLAVEGTIGLINTNTTRRNVNPHQGVHGLLYLVDGLYRFNPCGNLEPYVSAGIGVLGIRPNGFDSEHQGNINAGVGVQYFIDKAIAFRVEAKDLYTLTGGKNDYMLNLGMNFLFGPGY